jgi:precorrin-6B methylase 2
MSNPAARQWLWLSLALAAAALLNAQASEPPAPTNSTSRYEYRQQHSPDGIGKFYQGREIAQVMGHLAADWLERPERASEERPDLLLPALKLRPGGRVADIGAGSGFYTRKVAQVVGPQGVVYAVDIQPEMLELLTNKTAQAGFHNVTPILGTTSDPKLPAGAVDLVLMVDVYHEFDHPFEMIEAMLPALKPNGRIVFVEFRGEDPAVPIKPLHKMTTAQVRKEMAAHHLTLAEAVETLPRQHVLIFERDSAK